MSEIAAPLRRVLEGTGYLKNGMPAAHSVVVGSDNFCAGRQPSFQPEARWQNPSRDLNVYFKFCPHHPSEYTVATWQQEVWNEGSSPLLWIVYPESIDIYNGFGYPRKGEAVLKNRLEFFDYSELTKLDAFAGRLVMETGQFWRHESRVSRRNAVDQRLLKDLQRLEQDLLSSGLALTEAQGLIGRAIFAKYLVDRKIVTKRRLYNIAGYRDLQGVLRDRYATERLFAWLREMFNGDMFPPSTAPVPTAEQLARVANFLDADEADGQLSLFPYQFDVIPVELISTIYEQFVHSASGKQTDAYYTPLSAVALVLDDLMNGLTGDETVLDITCRSGVFLVEALRRLVRQKSGNGRPTRRAIRDTLYKQIYGVDKLEPAVRIAAFSLYLAALELDPNPRVARSLKFEPLIGKSLLVGDAHAIDQTPAGKAALTTKAGLKKFDLIVGNPPWSSGGRGRTASRPVRHSVPRSPRGESLDFVVRAKDFAHERTRIGMVLNAMPFFSRSAPGRNAAQNLVESLSPLTLVNLSNHSSWLFRSNMPAMALLARHRKQDPKHMMLVQAEWSPAGRRSHTIDMRPRDVTKLHVASWRRNPGLFKAAFFGCYHDRLLLDDLVDTHGSLEDRLRAIGTELKVGLTFGNRQKDASFLRGWPMLGRLPDERKLPSGVGDLSHFHMPPNLRIFDEETAERPRNAAIYRAPLLVVREYLRRLPRAQVAITDEDVVFTKEYFGIPFPPEYVAAAHLVAAVFSSALAAWYFIMTASTFGLSKRRLMPADVTTMPLPDLREATCGEPGRRLVRLVGNFRKRPPTDEGWRQLDEGVFDLYGLNAAQRLIVREGLERSTWQWKEGLLKSMEPADRGQLAEYAEAFLSVIDPWLQGADDRMRAEVYELPSKEPLRVVKFVFDQKPALRIAVLNAKSLRKLLASINANRGAPIFEELSRQTEIRLDADDAIFIIKPAARRNWLGGDAYMDARAALTDGLLARTG